MRWLHGCQMKISVFTIVIYAPIGSASHQLNLFFQHVCRKQRQIDFVAVS